MPLSMESWLNDVWEYVNEHDPDILTVLNTYIAEARFGRKYIEDDLAILPQGSNILEIGAGSLLLSCQLKREGFNVVALEPVSHGFSHFERLQELILQRAITLNCKPEILNQGAEELDIKDYFDFAFSINVMEHVRDVETVIHKVINSLHSQARYHFTCPNYLFPYEPHFNMLTLFSKSLTEKVFRKRIFEFNAIPDPKGTWESLNWISVSQISHIVKTIPELDVKFNRYFLVSTLVRINNDEEFATRRSKVMCLFIKGLLSLRLHYIAGLIPVMLQPIIDCTLVRQ